MQCKKCGQEFVKPSQQEQIELASKLLPVETEKESQARELLNSILASELPAIDSLEESEQEEAFVKFFERLKEKGENDPAIQEALNLLEKPREFNSGGIFHLRQFLAFKASGLCEECYMKQTMEGGSDDPKARSSFISSPQFIGVVLVLCCVGFATQTHKGILLCAIPIFVAGILNAIAKRQYKPAAKALQERDFNEVSALTTKSEKLRFGAIVSFILGAVAMLISFQFMK